MEPPPSEDDFECDYDGDQADDDRWEGDDDRSDDDMRSTDDDRWEGEPLMNGGRTCRASMLLAELDSELRQRFADYTLWEATECFLEDPEDFRTAAMLQFLHTHGHEAFEELHFGEEDDPANASGETPEASDARASGETIQYQHNQRKRKNAQALFSSAT